MAQVSVIVPVYKVEKYLERCVKSILAQTYSEFELILIDDGSPDNCPKICDEFAQKDARIHVIHQKNGGLSAARNAGLDWIFKNSSSQWVTFIDSDDWVHPNYLEYLLVAVKKYECPISMCQVLVTEEYKILNHQEIQKELQLMNTEVVYEDESLISNASWARLFRRDLFETVRFPLGKVNEDKFTTYRLLFRFKNIAVVCVPLYYYFINSEGIIRSEWTIRKLDILEATEQQLDFFKNNGWKRTYIYTLREYIHLLVYSLRNMKNKKEFQKQYIEVRRKLRNTLRKHHELLGMSFGKDFNTYKYAYPNMARIYRRLKALKW